MVNFEIMLRIHDATLAATARHQFETDLAQRATPITREVLKYQGSWWERLKQRLAYCLFVRLDPELAAIKLRMWQLRRNRFLQRAKRTRSDGA